jgi:hypothetical protein
VLRGRLSAVLLGGLAAVFLAVSPAQAAAPAAGNDQINAFPRGAQDVLGNDTGDGIRVTATGNPGHGTASCSELGACLYKADADYTGPDAFTYTITDNNGATAEGTVNVTVMPPPAGTQLVLADDDSATRAGTPRDVDVLANDSGKAPLAVTASSAPSHGSASCTQAGICTYTPDAGFVGSDGFHYTVTDGNQATKSADVHILVIAAGIAYDFSVAGAPNPVAAGGNGNWGFGVMPNTADVAFEELAALPLPEIATTLAGPHELIPSSVKFSKGWKSTGTGTAAATSDALLGDAITQAFPEPNPAISQGTGGDGHVPILVGSLVLAVFHHQQNTKISCVDRRTGAACPGYPVQLQASASNINGPGVVVGKKVYLHLWPNGYYGSGATQTAPIGLFCWDTETNDTCGWTILDRVGTEAAPKTGNPGASPPIRLGDHIYVAADTGKLYCRNTDLTPCATPSIDDGLGVPPSDAEYDIVGHGSRVFISRLQSPFSSTGLTTCVDVDTNAVCPGWGNGFKLAGGGYDVFNQYDTNGHAIGVCVAAPGGGTSAECVPDDGDPASPQTLSNFLGQRDGYYDAAQQSETGKRTFWGSLSHGGVGCWDWTTGALCTGTNFDSTGWVNQDAFGAGLPSAYGSTWDGACTVNVGDPGRVYTVDEQGNSPCTSLSSGTDRRVVDLRDQRCDGGVGAARWTRVTLGDVNAGELKAVTVTIRDDQTQEVLATGDLVKDGPLDLSGIDPNKHPRISLDANAEGFVDNAAPSSLRHKNVSRRVAVSATTSAWDDAIPPRLRLGWHADPQQGCFSTHTTTTCANAANTPISVTGHLAGAADKSAALAVLRDSACDPAQVQGASRAPVVCGGARQFRIHIRYKSKLIRKVKVLVGTTTQKIISMKTRPTVLVDLRKLPQSEVKVRIEIRTKSGKLLKGTRVYHPCAKKLPARGFKY